MERESQEQELPSWLLLGLESSPLPPNGVQLGVRVLVQVDVPAGQPLVLEIPFTMSPTGRVVRVPVHLTFNADGTLASAFRQENVEPCDDGSLADKENTPTNH